VAQEQTEKVTVWVGDGDRIVSFRRVEGYTEFSFTDIGYYYDFIESLTKRGYRVQ